VRTGGDKLPTKFLKRRGKARSWASNGGISEEKRGKIILRRLTGGGLDLVLPSGTEEGKSRRRFFGKISSPLGQKRITLGEG